MNAGLPELLAEDLVIDGIERKTLTCGAIALPVEETQRLEEPALTHALDRIALEETSGGRVCPIKRVRVARSDRKHQEHRDKG